MATVYITSQKTIEVELIGSTELDGGFTVQELHDLVRALQNHNVPATERVNVIVGNNGGAVLKVRFTEVFGCPAGDEDLTLHRLQEIRRVYEDTRPADKTTVTTP